MEEKEEKENLKRLVLKDNNQRCKNLDSQKLPNNKLD